MLKQYKDFDAKHIFKTFNSSPYYDGRLNGVDVLIMQSEETANQIIEDMIDLINQYRYSGCTLEYDKSDLTDLDIKRINETIIKYANSINADVHIRNLD